MATETTIPKPTAAEALTTVRDTLARGALPQIPNASSYGFLLADMGQLVSKLEAVKTVRSMQVRNG